MCGSAVASAEQRQPNAPSTAANVGCAFFKSKRSAHHKMQTRNGAATQLLFERQACLAVGQNRCLMFCSEASLSSLSDDPFDEPNPTELQQRQMHHRHDFDSDDSLSPTITHRSGPDFRPSIPLAFQPSIPLAFQPSIPLAFRPSIPLALQPSIPLAFRPSIPLAFQPSIPLAFHPSSLVCLLSCRMLHRPAF